MSYVIVDIDHMNGQGIIGVQFQREMKPNTKYKVYIHKDEYPEYHYNISESKDWFPLQHGNGTYTLKIFEQVSGTQYQPLQTKLLTLAMGDPLDVFLSSNIYVEWDSSMMPIRHAADICKDLTKPYDKVEELWKYVVTNFSYDSTLAKAIIDSGGKYNYTPCLTDIFMRKTGICFGLTALFNAMCRSQGIRAKMLHGQVKNVGYHAWSEVWLYDQWCHIDITFELHQRIKNAMSFLTPVFDISNYSTRFIY